MNILCAEHFPCKKRTNKSYEGSEQIMCDERIFKFHTNPKRKYDIFCSQKSWDSLKIILV